MVLSAQKISLTRSTVFEIVYGSIEELPASDDITTRFTEGRHAASSSYVYRRRAHVRELQNSCTIIQKEQMSQRSSMIGYKDLRLSNEFKFHGLKVNRTAIDQIGQFVKVADGTVRAALPGTLRGWARYGFLPTI